MFLGMCNAPKPVFSTFANIWPDGVSRLERSDFIGSSDSAGTIFAIYCKCRLSSSVPLYALETKVSTVIGGAEWEFRVSDSDLLSVYLATPRG